MNTKREKVLAALEQACREEFGSKWLQDVLARATSDEHCVRYGGITPRIVVLAALDLANPNAVRRLLEAEVGAGRVLRHQRRYAGVIRWWPVGLLANLQSEKLKGEKV